MQKTYGEKRRNGLLQGLAQVDKLLLAPLHLVYLASSCIRTLALPCSFLLGEGTIVENLESQRLCLHPGNCRALLPLVRGVYCRP